MSRQPFLPAGLSWCARIVVTLLTSLTACLSLTFVCAGSPFFVRILALQPDETQKNPLRPQKSMLQMYVYLANWGHLKCPMVRAMGLVDAEAVGLVPIPPWDPHISRVQPGDIGH